MYIVTQDLGLSDPTAPANAKHEHPFDADPSGAPETDI